MSVCVPACVTRVDWPGRRPILLGFISSYPGWKASLSSSLPPFFLGKSKRRALLWVYSGGEERVKVEGRPGNFFFFLWRLKLSHRNCGLSGPEVNVLFRPLCRPRNINELRFFCLAKWVLEVQYVIGSIFKGFRSDIQSYKAHMVGW